MINIKGLGLLVICLGLLVLPQAARARDSIHADIVVNEDSSVTVKETIRIESGDAWFKHEFDRNLPTAGRMLFGLRHPKGFQVLECLRDGRPETFKIFGDKGLLIRVGDFMDSYPIPRERTYTLKYRIEDQISSSGNGDSLTWTVTEKYWGWWPIDASASVSLPGDASAHLKDNLMLVEPEGKTETVPSAGRVKQGVVYFDAPGPLDQSEGLAISLTWPRGYLKKSPASSLVRQLAAENRGILVGLGGLALLLAYYAIAWMVLGRGPEKGTIVVRYEAPQGMSPAVMRYIWKMGYDERCFTAALLSMASKGHLKIWENRDRQYVVTRTKGSTPLSDDETKITEQLLPKSGEIMLETEDRRLMASVSAFSEHLREKYEKIVFVGNVRYFGIGLIISAAMVVASGLGALEDPLDMAVFVAASSFVTMSSPPLTLFVLELLKRWKAALVPGGAKGLRIFKAVIFSIAALFSFGYIFESLSMMVDMATPYIIFFIAAAVVVNFVFYQLMRAPTRAGRKLFDGIEGFREFLLMTEKDRMNLLNPPDRTPELFNRYLPYALALDVEQEWAEQFSSLLAGASLGEPGSSPAWGKGSVVAILGNLLKSS